MTRSVNCVGCKAYVLSRNDALHRGQLWKWAMTHALEKRHHVYMREEGKITSSINGRNDVVLSSLENGEHGFKP